MRKVPCDRAPRRLISADDVFRERMNKELGLPARETTGSVNLKPLTQGGTGSFGQKTLPGAEIVSTRPRLKALNVTGNWCGPARQRMVEKQGA